MVRDCEQSLLSLPGGMLFGSFVRTFVWTPIWLPCYCRGTARTALHVLVRDGRTHSWYPFVRLEKMVRLSKNQSSRK